MVHKWFKKVMTVINLLFTLPVIWVVVRELFRPGPVMVGRVFATAAMVCLPLAGTIAITIAGCAVLAEDNPE